MVAFSDIIDFLLRLLSDETARADFEKDPQASLGKAGLEGVSGQDVRDARLQLADSGAVHATDDGAPLRLAPPRPGPRDRPHDRALHRDGPPPGGARRHVLHDRRPRHPVLPIDLRQRRHGDRRPQRQHRDRDPGQRRQRLRRRRQHRRRRVVQLRQRRGRDPGQRRQRGRLADRRRRDRRRPTPGAASRRRRRTPAEPTRPPSRPTTWPPSPGLPRSTRSRSTKPPPTSLRTTPSTTRWTTRTTTRRRRRRRRPTGVRRR